jgi:8-oxo-dGTP pyrophosphatase MutT (NUDIX family)
MVQTTKLQDTPAKRCLTVNAWLVHHNKVLLIRHKLLQLWLAPGGHVEQNELPHQAAEREFFEETGLKVRVISAFPVLPSLSGTENLPLPFLNNLHWINRPGEHKKRRNGDVCEQHYAFGFFVEALESLDRIGRAADPDEGIEAVRWFTLSELKKADTHDIIRQEASYAIKHHPLKT